MGRICGKSVLSLTVATSAALLLVGLFLTDQARIVAAPKKEPEPLRLEQIPFDGKQAYEYLKQICTFGPRPTGSRGMTAQWQLVAAHFQKLGAQVSPQVFYAKSPLDGNEMAMANMIVQWHPDRKERILLCTHYDTHPYPDQDARNPKGTFIGANGGASGVAVLMELGKSMPKLESKYGVDFVLFDASDFVVTEHHKKVDGDPHFIGSDFFAHGYVKDPPPYKYQNAVMLDLVGGENMRIYQEFTNMSWSDSRPLIQDIWKVAYNNGVRDFIPDRKRDFSDDHEKLHAIAKIPTCAIIDVEYPQWRTEQDTPEHCSPLSLAKVGWVMLEWLKQAK